MYLILGVCWIFEQPEMAKNEVADFSACHVSDVEFSTSDGFSTL